MGPFQSRPQVRIRALQFPQALGKAPTCGLATIQQMHCPAPYDHPHGQPELPYNSHALGTPKTCTFLNPMLIKSRKPRKTARYPWCKKPCLQLRQNTGSLILGSKSESGSRSTYHKRAKQPKHAKYAMHNHKPGLLPTLETVSKSPHTQFFVAATHLPQKTGLEAVHNTTDVHRCFAKFPLWLWPPAPSPSSLSPKGWQPAYGNSFGETSRWPWCLWHLF